MMSQPAETGRHFDFAAAREAVRSRRPHLVLFTNPHPETSTPKNTPAAKRTETTWQFTTDLAASQELSRERLVTLYKKVKQSEIARELYERAAANALRADKPDLSDELRQSWLQTPEEDAAGHTNGTSLVRMVKTIAFALVDSREIKVPVVIAGSSQPVYGDIPRGTSVDMDQVRDAYSILGLDESIDSLPKTPGVSRFTNAESAYQNFPLPELGMTVSFAFKDAQRRNRHHYQSIPPHVVMWVTGLAPQTGGSAK